MLCGRYAILPSLYFLRCIYANLYSPAQRGVQEWKARISIRSSTETLQDSSSFPPPHVTPQAKVASVASPLRSLTPHLCYACHTTLTSRSSRGTIPGSKLDSATRDAVMLPVWVSSQLQPQEEEPVGNIVADQNGEVWATKNMKQSDIKASVADFLLDTDS